MVTDYFDNSSYACKKQFVVWVDDKFIDWCWLLMNFWELISCDYLSYTFIKSFLQRIFTLIFKCASISCFQAVSKLVTKWVSHTFYRSSVLQSQQSQQSQQSSFTSFTSNTSASSDRLSSIFFKVTLYTYSRLIVRFQGVL